MISPEAQRLLESRYLQSGENWEGLVSRVVNHVCERESDEFKLSVFNQIHNLVWLPNSPCLASAGTKNGGLMACFVVGPEHDTIEDHFETIGHIAKVGKRGGGCGFTGTFIRPDEWDVAGSPHGSAYGPNKWAGVVSHALHIITQGNFRAMALMYSISTDNLWQPEHKRDHEFRTDLDQFINLKHIKKEGELYNFNQSIFASDKWMQRAMYESDSPQAIQLDKLAYNAWMNGEPGLLFADTINNNTPYQECGCKIYTTNPCGEQPLPPFGSCNLGSINLNHDVFYPESDGRFDFEKLKEVVGYMTIFLDDVGSVNRFPSREFEDWYRAHRPIGIGVMGYADALMRQGITYGSDDSLSFIDAIMSTIKRKSYEVSKNMGYNRGMPSHAGKAGRRNITTVSIAPTGSIAMIAGCSHGIEPVFSPIYKRTDQNGNEYIFRHPLRNESFFRSSIGGDYDRIPDWQDHIHVQMAAQASTDSAVSKTINMVNGVTKDDVYDAMTYAYDVGCKGITIYRDGSRNLQVLEELTEEDSLLIDCPTGVCDL